MKTPENIRLEEARTRQVPWKKWGSYLSERQWGMVAIFHKERLNHGEF